MRSLLRPIKRLLLVRDRAEAIHRSKEITSIKDKTGDGKDVLSELLEMLDAQQLTINNHIEELSANAAELKHQSGSREEDYVMYTVEPGDTLGKICTELGIDYRQNRSMILELNHIRDENVIPVGQVLMFPTNKKAR